MSRPQVTLIRHCAGSSATAIVTALQLGRKVAFAIVQGSLHMRTLTPKKTEWMYGTVTKATEERDKGEEASSGGMGKSPQRWI